MTLYVCCFLAGDQKISNVSEEIFHIFVSRQLKIYDFSNNRYKKNASSFMAFLCVYLTLYVSALAW